MTICRSIASSTAVLAIVLCWLPLSSAAAPSLDGLRSELARQRAHEHALAQSIGGLGASVTLLERQIAIVRGREAAVRDDLARDRRALAEVRAALGRERARVVRLRAVLARARLLLGRQLVSAYERDRPDLVSVLLDARGFADLLDRMTFLRAAEHVQQRLIVITRAAKAAAQTESGRLADVESSDRRLAEGAAVRVRALAGMDTILGAKQADLAHALGAQEAALSASRVRSGALDAQIAHLRLEQAQAAAAAARATAARAAAPATTGPSPSAPALPAGGWSIPEAIVLCESGGQNLPPNGAGASGYYQILPATWRQFGGAGAAAWLASKAEQDAVASRIWNGGAGASSWVCAGLMGVR